MPVKWVWFHLKVLYLPFLPAKDPDHLLVLDLLVAVLRVIADGHHVLGLVAAHAVVQHDVGKYPYARLVEGADGVQVFLLRAVLGAHGALLVELAQVVHVIDGVAHVRLAGGLVGRGQPHLGDAQVVQVFRLRGAPPPPDAQVVQVFRLRGAPSPPKPVVGQIPFKVLHHRFIGKHDPYP